MVFQFNPVSCEALTHSIKTNSQEAASSVTIQLKSWGEIWFLLHVWIIYLLTSKLVQIMDGWISEEPGYSCACKHTVLENSTFVFLKNSETFTSLCPERFFKWNHLSVLLIGEQEKQHVSQMNSEQCRFHLKCWGRISVHGNVCWFKSTSTSVQYF